MKRWLGRIFIVLGFLAFAALVFFGFPFIAFGSVQPFAALWVRLVIIGVVLLILLIWAFLRWRKRRKAQAELEEALTQVEETTGDGEVLGEKIKEAMSVLKKSGSGRMFLYDLPWYVIIGPPGAGKTTALLNSGIEFPMAKSGDAAISGIGGTRYCDWWFAEEAVMIDTAGRYTTQDSDAEADMKSWQSFLELLKRYRSKQPINGVILAFSVEDLLTSDPATLRQHAETIRTRLAEIHETLKIDFPVYVLFTKADLISGFREYFASFSVSRREKVWGATFQTSDRSAQTFEQVPGEFDALVKRLSEEAIHRLSEEPDGISRISIFGLPAQMAMLKGKVSELLRLVFEPTRYHTNAILRGFYFTSGTQEGTPIDQVLGAMGSSAGMSGKGKSFFLHDLMKRVIFKEQGWVSYDGRAVRRGNLFRMASFACMLLLSIGLIAAWGYSWYLNRELIASTEAAVEEYEIAANEDLRSGTVSDTDLLRVSSPLNLLRDMPAGFAGADAENISRFEGFGLGQRNRVGNAARAAYRDGLERLFRPRLVLYVEEQLQGAVRDEDGLSVYNALKVYKLLGGDTSAIGDYDEVVLAWFEAEWRQFIYPGAANRPAREDLFAHLEAMLELDDDQTVLVPLNPDLIEKAEAAAARMPVGERAYALIVATADLIDLPGFNVALMAGRDADRILQTADGSDLEALEVHPLYTFAGFHDFFLGELSEVADKLERDKWVLGAEAERARVDDQITRLGTTLLRRYYDEWFDEWDRVLGNLTLTSMAADKPDYNTLQIAASPTASPLLLLISAIAAETRLTTPFLDDGGGVPEAGKKVGGRAGRMLLSRTSGLSRIGIVLATSGKSQDRAGAAPPQLPGQVIEDEYRDYHALTDGPEGARPIDGLIKNLGEVREVLYIAARQDGSQDNGQATIGLLRSTLSRLPEMPNRLISGAIRELEGDAASASLAQLSKLIQSEVVDSCTQITSNRFPFSSSPTRQVPISAFAELFGPQGTLDSFFNTHLASHADVSGKKWVWREDSPLAGSLSPGTLKQFERAAAIREAFFPAGAAQPEVHFTVTLVNANNRVRRVDFLVGAEEVRMRSADPGPHAMVWGGAERGGAAAIILNRTKIAQGQALRTEGSWALLELIQNGSPTQVGDVLKLRYTIKGRFVGFEMRFDALSNPFNLRELFEFRCPQGL